MVIDGIQPAAVVTPPDADRFAATLAAAATAGQSVVITGGGTKLSWGRSPSAVDVMVSTAALNRLLAHRHGDLTATVEAGASLRDVNRQLARRGQWLPIDSAFDAATIGGIVSTNDAGPLRHRFGTPRDLLIGATLALADGRQVKAGGTVVKNVAGYDLGRLVSGSFGSLAGIVTVTFKLAPLPAASATLGVLYRDAAALAKDAQLLASSQFELTTLDVQATGEARQREYRLLVRLASSPAATAAQLAAIRALVAGDAHEISGRAEEDLWRIQVTAPWTNEATTIRLAWLPASLGPVLSLVDQIGAELGSGLLLTGRAGVGTGLLRVDGTPDVAVDVVNRLRAQPDLVGNVVVLRAPREVKARVDVWGDPGSAAAVLRAIKQALDPRGVLNAGRGPA